MWIGKFIHGRISWKVWGKIVVGNRNILSKLPAGEPFPSSFLLILICPYLKHFFLASGATWLLQSDFTGSFPQEITPFFSTVNEQLACLDLASIFMIGKLKKIQIAACPYCGYLFVASDGRFYDKWNCISGSSLRVLSIQMISYYLGL